MNATEKWWAMAHKLTNEDSKLQKLMDEDLPLNYCPEQVAWQGKSGKMYVAKINKYNNFNCLVDYNIKLEELSK